MLSIGFLMRMDMLKPYRALEPPLFELSQLKPSGISGCYAFHEVRV